MSQRIIALVLTIILLAELGTLFYLKKKNKDFDQQLRECNMRYIRDVMRFQDK